MLCFAVFSSRDVCLTQSGFISHSNISSTYFHYENKCVCWTCGLLQSIACLYWQQLWAGYVFMRAKQHSAADLSCAGGCGLALSLQRFLTPDSPSHLHNPHTCSSNARLTYWLPNNAASNNNDVWSEADGGTHLKKHTQSAAAGAAWTGLITAGTSLLLDCVHTRSRWGLLLVPADELTTRLDTAAAGVISEGASFFLFVCLFVCCC